MRREILFEMLPFPPKKSVIDISDPVDTGSYFSNMSPAPNPPHYDRPKGASPASRARHLSSEPSETASHQAKNAP